MFKNLYRHKELIWTLVKREFASKYKRSILGVVWSFLQPVFLLITYTFVFSEVLQIKFRANDNSADSALCLFCGIISWMAFSETLTRSASIITENANLVKKVVFPLEILPVVLALTSLIHLCIDLAILFIGILIINQSIHWTLILIAGILIPQFFLMAGLGWFLSSIGVFIRDTRTILGMILTVWMFLTPIFYPSEIIPQKFQFMMNLNPMKIFIDSYRNALLMGTIPDIGNFMFASSLAVGIYILGYYWFMKTRHFFADII